eukprot:CAMPEP_0177692804 /NCGR_PEP_ID=MMETSP0484_2-20121128/2055_1 /TAXON_ID=354590 /ORGANISM="Rhodomonas lens, Strain RHODO" /LENGTH=330 /DNA_ID=CAMNT_0019203559 /DNA_START=284 /DNA_END=1276 /DNA_ORIENTATION=+
MGLGKHSTAREVLEFFDVDLRGKTALVTGGNAGLGLETCKALASRGCRVLLCSRDLTAGETAAQKEILDPAGIPGYEIINQPDVEVLSLDLADFASINRCAEKVLTQVDRIDLLVLNAGVCGLRGKTSDEFEAVMGTNYVGHAQLCNLLLPKLIAQTSQSRIVVLASVGHKLGLVDPQDLNCSLTSFFGWGSYLHSKLAAVLYTRALHDHLAATNAQHVTATCLSPGRIFTGIWRHAPPPLRALVPLFCDREVEGGAASIVFCCVAPECGDFERGGAYIADCASAQTSAAARDPQLRAALWLQTNRLLDAASRAAARRRQADVEADRESV